MAISSVSFDSDSCLNVTRKSFRKKLMTGGAVISLPKELNEVEQQKILKKCKPEALEGPGIARLVLVALAKHSDLNSITTKGLLTTGIRDIERILFRRDLYQDSGRGSIRSLDRLAKDKEEFSSLSAIEKREIFLNNIGSSARDIETRVALVKSGNLPEDLNFLFRRDPAAKVRFAVRSVPVG